jgi:RNA polymerase sigma-70 factor (ECF subfamily)
LKHFLSDARDHDLRLKRGGGVIPESLSPSSGSDTSCSQVADPAAVPDADFDRGWALRVMARALEILQTEMGRDGKAAQFDCLKPWLMGDGPTLSQAAVSRQLGLTEGAVKVTVHRLRKRFREIVRAEIAQTLRDPALVDEELRHLVAALS